MIAALVKTIRRSPVLINHIHNQQKRKNKKLVCMFMIDVLLVLHKVQIDVTGPPEQNRDVSRFDCQSIGLLKTNYVILILATCSPIGRQRVSISSLCPRQREQFSNKRFTSCRTENQRPRAHDTKRRSKRTDTNYTLHTMRTRTRN